MSEEDVIKLKNDFRDVMNQFIIDIIKPEILHRFSEQHFDDNNFTVDDITLGNRLDFNNYNNKLYPHFDIMYFGYLSQHDRTRISKPIIKIIENYFPDVVISQFTSFSYTKKHRNPLNESIPKKSIIKQMVTTMDYREEDAKDELENMIEWLNSLPNELKLYRIVYVDSEDDIDLERPGAHYAMDKKELLSSHSWLDGYGDKKFLITVIAKKSMIKKSTTLMVRAIYPNENEILLKNNGKGVKVVSVVEIK